MELIDLITNLGNPYAWSRVELKAVEPSDVWGYSPATQTLFTCPQCFALTPNPGEHLLWHTEKLGV